MGEGLVEADVGDDADGLVALPEALERVQGDVQRLGIQRPKTLVDEGALDAHGLLASGQSVTTPACN